MSIDKIYRDPIELRKKAENSELTMMVTGTLSAITAYIALKYGVVDIETSKNSVAPNWPESLATLAAPFSGTSLAVMGVAAIRATSYRRRADALETDAVLAENQSQQTIPRG